MRQKRILFILFSILLSSIFILPLFSSGVKEDVSIAPYRTILNAWDGPFWAYRVTFEDAVRSTGPGE